MNCFEYICHCFLLIYLESKIWECAMRNAHIAYRCARRNSELTTVWCVRAYGLVYLKCMICMYNALDAIKSNARDGRDDCCSLYLLTLLIRNLSTFVSAYELH